MPTEKELTVGVVQFCCIDRVKLCKDFSFTDPLGRNLLFHAARRTPEIFHFVLSKGLDLTKTNCLGETCLTEACRSNNPNVVECILNHPDSVNLDLNSSLKWACVVENYSMVSMLLEKGADPVKAMDQDDSLLNFCVSKSRLDIVRKLLQYGANPNTKLFCGYTSYTTCISYNRLDAAVLLRIYGANSWTPLRNHVLLRLTKDPNFSQLQSFISVSYAWSNLEVALASRSVKDLKFLIENRKIDLRNHKCSNILEFTKKENLYTNQPSFHPPLYDYIKNFYIGWTRKNHHYYSKNFRQNIRLILSRSHKIQPSIPEELWLMIFNFILLE